MFPIGGFSIHMTIDINIPSGLNTYLAVEDLESLAHEFFDHVNITLFRGRKIIAENQKFVEFFENFGNMIRKKFLFNVNGSEYLPMTNHTIIAVQDYEGVWSVDGIRRICEIDVPSNATLDDLRREYKIGNPYRWDPEKCDIDFSGKTCTLTCTVDMTCRGEKYWINEICDVVEFAHLRKLILEDYDYFINQNSLQILNRLSDKNLIRDMVISYIKHTTWFNERFLANLEKLMSLDERFPSNSFKENVIFKVLDMIKYEETLKILKKDLGEAQKFAGEYRENLSRRIDTTVSFIEKTTDFLAKVGGLR